MSSVSPGSVTRADALQAEVDEHWWYHTIELPGGVVTPGWYDLRPLARAVPMPASLAGKRCLDVGTANGFWAFEMERRGAAEVIALDADLPDLDWPVRSDRQAVSFEPSFELARRALGSEVKRVTGTVYDAANVLDGQFDYIFIGAILLHLRQPIDALTAIREVSRGEILSVDVISLRLTMRYFRAAAALSSGNSNDLTWWTPNREAHTHWFHAAGWRVDERSRRPHRTQFGAGLQRAPKPTPPRLRERLVADLKHRHGVLTGWVRAHPDPSV